MVEAICKSKSMWFKIDLNLRVFIGKLMNNGTVRKVIFSSVLAFLTATTAGFPS